jgi:DNA polymerase-3 subunit delta
MIIFLFGPDNYRSKQKLKEIVKGYKEKNKQGLDLKSLEGKDFTFEDFKTNTEQISMFQEKRLVVLEDVFKNKEFIEKFLEEKERFLKNDNIIIFYQSEKIDKRTSLYKFLHKKNNNQTFQEFEFFKENNLKKWIKIKIQELGGKINESAINLLIDYVGSDLWQMEGEISKLVNFKKEQEIKKEDVELLVKPNIETDIFKTIEAIANKNKKKALKLFQSHLDKGVEIPYLIAMIAYQFRVLLIIKDLINRNLSITKNSSLHPFVVRKSRALVDKFTLEELKRIYQKILKIDTEVKTGKVEPRTAVDLLIIEI